jgi:hypothetical protein
MRFDVGLASIFHQSTQEIESPYGIRFYGIATSIKLAVDFRSRLARSIFDPLVSEEEFESTAICYRL